MCSSDLFCYGGTCVIRGCVPKKLLVYASRFPQSFEESRGFGWNVPPATFDWEKLVAAKNAEITRLEGAYSANLDKAGGRIGTIRSSTPLPAAGRKPAEKPAIGAAPGNNPPSQRARKKAFPAKKARKTHAAGR